MPPKEWKRESLTRRELAAALNEINTYLLTLIGPCDHDHNICYCEERDAAQYANELIKQCRKENLLYEVTPRYFKKAKSYPRGRGYGKRKTK